MADPDAGPPGDDRGISPILWILVLIALFAFGWYLYNRSGASAPPPASGQVTIGSEQEAAALRERAGDTLDTPDSAFDEQPAATANDDPAAAADDEVQR